MSASTESLLRQILEEVVTQDVAELQQQTGVDRLSFKDVVNVGTLTLNLLCDSNNRYSLLVHYFSNFLSDVHSFLILFCIIIIDVFKHFFYIVWVSCRTTV